MEVRVVRPQEYDEAGRVTAEAYREHVRAEWEDDWARYLVELADVRRRAPVSTVLVAVEDGRVLGCATVEYETPITKGEPPLPETEARLRMVAVDPWARGQGIGQALLDASLADARARGKSRMVLNTTDVMKAAQRLYERNGFDREDDVELDSGFGMRTYGREI
ncbi:MAG: GNAT family N-acetyltransferase [Actinobacteria bacterium]|nr:GNAT family N-acetyltransferase [Actinomycetota bacterium]